MPSAGLTLTAFSHLHQPAPLGLAVLGPVEKRVPLWPPTLHRKWTA